MVSLASTHLLFALFKDALKIPHALGCATGVTDATAKKLIAELNAIKTYISTKKAPQVLETKKTGRRAETV